MNRKARLSVVIVFLVLLFSCGQAKQESASNRPAAPPKQEAGSIDRDALEKAQQKKADSQESTRKIVKEGDIAFETNDTKETRSFVNKAVKDANGYIAEDVQDTDDGQVRTRLLIRVPAEKFDLLIEAVTAHVGRLDRKSVKARDVTEEYIDLDARLRSQRDLEKKFQQLLGQARTLDEVFKINQQIAGVREKIEAVEGKLKYLNDSVVYSRLSVTYYEPGRSGIRFFSRVWRGIGNGWTYFALFIIGIVNIWPFIVVAALIVAAIVFFRRRRKKEVKAQ